MSKEHAPVGLAIEWSPRGVVAYDSATRRKLVGPDLQSLGLGSRDAVFALSRRGVFVRTARVPDASADDVRAILAMKAGEIFPLPVIDLAWDFVLTSDVNDEGRLAVVAAVPCADLRRAFEATAAAGLKVKAAVPLAFGSTLIAKELGMNDAAVVERAEDGPAVDVVIDGALRASRAAPASVPMELEVSRALTLAGIDDVPTVAAGGAELAEADRTSDRTALAALAETPFDRLKLRLELPEAVAARETAANNRSIRIAASVLVLSGLLAATSAVNYHDAEAKVTEAQTRSNAYIQQVKNDVKKLTSSVSEQVATNDKLKQAFEPAQKPSDVLALITNAVPEGTWLNGITYERGRPLTLRGTSKTAEAAAVLMRNLATNPEGRFRDVVLTNANNTLVSKVPVVQFVITAFPVGNTPLVDKADPKAAKK